MTMDEQLLKNFISKLNKSEAKEELIEKLINDVINKLHKKGLSNIDIKNNLIGILKEAQDNTKALKSINLAKQLLNKIEK